jgi:hypothetical protein
MRHLTPDAYNLIKGFSSREEHSAMAHWLAPRAVAKHGVGTPGITTTEKVTKFGRVHKTAHTAVYRDSEGKPVAYGVGSRDHNNEDRYGVTSLFHDHTREGVLPKLAAGRVLRHLKGMGYDKAHPSQEHSTSFAAEQAISKL